MATHLRAYDHTKTALGLMPDYNGLMQQVQLNDHGVLTFHYPPNGVNASFLDRDILYLSIVEDGIERSHLYVLDDESDNVAAKNSIGQMVKITARGMLSILEQAEVYPGAHVAGGSVTGLEPTHAFKNMTPGAIFIELIRRAKNRGAILPVEVGFTTTHDSAGVPWPKRYTVTYATGTSYLEALRAACDNGWMDMRMNGFELELFVANGTLNQKKPNVILRTAQQVQNGPRRRTRRGIITTMLGIGSEKNIVEISDPAALARFGRREGHASDGRMTESGSLLSMTQHELERRRETKEGFTLTLSTTPPKGEAWPIPLKDFHQGDSIGWEAMRLSSTELEPLRVRSISFAWTNPNSAPECEVELNDQFVERGLKLERQMQGIVQGSVTAAPPPVNVEGPDVTVPVRPGAIDMAGTVYTVHSAHRVSAAISWEPVAENQDGSPYTDHDVYLVSWSHDLGASWTPDAQVKQPFTWISDLTPGVPFAVRVKSRDRSGNESEYAEASVPALPVDDVAPPRPTPPVVRTERGVSTLTWDGLSVEGRMPIDFAHIDAYIEGDEKEVELPASYSGKWAQRGIVMNPAGGSKGGTLRFEVVAAPKGTAAGLLLSSLPTATWSATQLVVRSLADGTHTLTLTIGSASTAVDLVPLGLAAGAAFNVDVKALSGTLTVAVNGIVRITAPLPAGADYLLTDPVDAAGLTVARVSDSQVTYYPPGHPQHIGRLATTDSPSFLTVSGQELLRTYAAWFVAVDTAGNESAGSERTTFASQPLVDADLIGTTVQTALEEASVALGALDGALDGFRADLEAVQTSADGKNRLHHSATEPAGPHVFGDTWYDTDDGNKMYHWTGTAWQHTALGAAALATAVNDAISGAVTTADAAKVSADGKTTNTYSATTPTDATPGKIAGDTWYRRQADGQIIAQWEWSGTEWIARTLHGAVLTTIDAGKITAGTLSANRIAADSIGVTKLAIGSFDNLVPDPLFTNVAGDWGAMSGAYSVDPTGSRTGKTALKIVNEPLQQGKYSPVVPVQPGARYLIRCWVRSDVEIPAGGIGLYMSPRNAAGGSTGAVSVTPSHAAIPANTWTELTGMSPAVTATAVGVAFGVFSQAANATSSVWFDSFSATRAAAGELIVDGSITTGKLAAGSITAESGVIASLDASKITVGTLNADRLAAGSISVSKLLIGDGENLFPNGNGQTGTSADFPGFTYDADTPEDGDAVGSFACATRRTNVGTARPKVRPGEKYRVSVWLKADAFGSRFYLQLRGYDKTGATAYPTTPTYVVQNLELATWWQRFDAEVVFPFGVDHCRAEFFMNHANGSVITTQRVAGFSMRRMNAGELIVDGAITSNKIAARTITAENLVAGTITANELKAGSITADKIATNAITANHIVAGAIDGTIITGATFRTNASAWRMELDDNGLRAMDDSPSKIGQMTLTRYGITAQYANVHGLDATNLTTGSLSATVDLRPSSGSSTYIGYGPSFKTLRPGGIPDNGVSFVDTAYAEGGGITSIEFLGQGVKKADSVGARIFTSGKVWPLNETALVIEAPKPVGVPAVPGLLTLSARDVWCDGPMWTNANGTPGPVSGSGGASIYHGNQWWPIVLNSGWENYGASYATAAMKLVGTRVFLRGLIKSVGPVPAQNTVIAYSLGTVGPRQGSEIFSVAGSTGYAEVQVNGDNVSSLKGVLLYRSGLTAAANWLSLSGLSYSIS